jgi:enediyne biosynthesis protein E3
MSGARGFGGVAARAKTGGHGRVRALDRLLARLLSLDPTEACFARRGFPGGPARPRLEAAGGSFIAGYNQMIGDADVAAMMRRLAERPVSLRGFFAEGAAMGAAVRGLATPWHSPLRAVVAALTPCYVHLAHVAAGWAMARAPWAATRIWRALDPTLAPLALDGRGFHDGYFLGDHALDGRRRPAGLAGAVYDQGTGRSLWFSRGADVDAVESAIRRFDDGRRADLWAGIGLACVYAGGADAAGIDRLMASAGRDLRWLRQGAAFAVAALARAGDVLPEPARAAERISGMPHDALAPLADEALRGAMASGLDPLSRYQDWRARVASALEGHAGP